jgi:hypothetical protein
VRGVGELGIELDKTAPREVGVTEKQVDTAQEQPIEEGVWLPGLDPVKKENNSRTPNPYERQ